MTRTSSILILFTFGISLSLFPVLEGIHDLLHHFENKIHHHEAGPGHRLADHHLQQHDGGNHEMDMDDYALGTNFISLLFGYLNVSEKSENEIPLMLKIEFAELNCTYTSINLSPPTPPPLVVTIC